ncbi:MAG: TIGR03545 family protein [Bacteriovoracaceae bacterium]
MTDENTEQSKVEESQEKDQKKKKPKKPKGPIRTGAVIFLLAFAGLSYTYGHFFFDSHLKKLIEFAGTQVHGAEVNVAKVRSSFFSGTFELHGLQVTNKEKPVQNLVGIGLIRFEFLWDALLRAKFVVEDASIKNIQVYYPRKRPGRVIPISESKSGKSKELRELEAAVLDQGQKELEGNALGDVAEILGGKDPKDQLKDFKGELKTEQRIQEITKELDQKEGQWKKKFEELKQTDDLKKTLSEVKKFKFDKKNPLKSIKKLDELLKQSKAKIKDFNNSYKELKKDIDKVASLPNQVDGWIEEDIKNLENKFKIPDLNFGDFSKSIFTKLLFSKLGPYRKYVEMAREYMPPEKSEEDKKPEIEAKARAEGKTYRFPVTKGYPLFWLKKSTISSKASEAEFSGDILGELVHVTTDPVLVKRPAKLTLKGDFPHQQIYGVDAKVVVDRTTKEPTESVVARVGAYPINEQKFSDSEKLKFGFHKAQGNLNLNLYSEGGKVQAKLVNKFQKVDYLVDAKSKSVKEIFTNVTNDLGPILVTANANGSWEDLNWRINSNLGRELSRGIKAQLKAKVDEAKNKLRKLVNDRVGGKKDELKRKVSSVQKEAKGKLDSKKKELSGLQKKITNEIKGQKKKSAKDKVKKKTKKAIDKLKKKFKFKF